MGAEKHKECTCHGHHHEHEHHHEHRHEHEHGAACCEHCEAKLKGTPTLRVGELLRIVVSALFFALLFFVTVDGWQRALLYAIPYLVVGYEVLFGAVKNIARGKVFDEQFLMTVATLGAFAIGDFPEAVAVMLFYCVGEYLQTLAVGKSRRSVAALMDLCPDVAVVIRGGKEETVSPESVRVGETVIVRPGEKIPLDGTILKGETAINYAALTGESLPLECGEGGRVMSGGINEGGLIYIKVESPYRESTVARVLNMVENAAGRKARVERFITRFSRWYTPVVVTAALLLALVPPLFLGGGFAVWGYRALSFLVISCPCALVISVPLTFFCGIGAASRRGVLVKGANYLEQLARVDTVAFDKTGTITKGEFAVSHIFVAAGDEETLLSTAASLEQYSNHPLARAVVARYKAEPTLATEIREERGKGVVGAIDGEICTLGNAAFLCEKGYAITESVGVGTAVHVARGKCYLGYLLLADVVREEAATVLSNLKRAGVKRAVMLTGDNEKVAQKVAAHVGIDEVRAGLLPDEKVTALEGVMQTATATAYVGDGVNDAPVLARADVGIAMGGVGSDAALESADVVLVEDRLERLPIALKIARKTVRIVRANIAFALAAKAAILVLAALGVANMWIAVFGDVGVMLIALLNALRAGRL